MIDISIKKKRKLSQSELWGWLFAMPAIIGFLVFKVVPMLASFYFSLTDVTLGIRGNFVGLGNYVNLFTKDPFFPISLKVTFTYAIMSVPLHLICAFLVAMLLNVEGVKGKKVYRTLVYLPCIVPAVANGMLWKWIFNPNFGLLNQMLSFVGLPGSDWIYSKTTVLPSLAFMNVWGIGGTMIIFLAGLQGVNRALYEAIEVDGGNFWHKFVYVTIPMMTPTIFFNLVMGVIGALQAFYQAFVMTNGGPSNGSLFFGYHIYRTAFESQKAGYAAAMSWILFIIVMFFTAIVFKTSKFWVYYEEGGN
jgi:multiple sugar transport system permease protein